MPTALPTRAASLFALLLSCLAVGCVNPGVNRSDTDAARTILAQAGLDPGVINAALANIENKVEAQEQRVDDAIEKAKDWIPAPWGELLSGVGALAGAAFYAKRKAESETNKLDRDRDLRRMARGENATAPMLTVRRSDAGIPTHPES